MSIITTSTIYRSLKATLDSIITDPLNNPSKDLDYTKYLDVKNMSDAYEDDAEVASDLLLAEKVEGANATVGSIQEGYVTRYIARTYARHLHIAEESIEDSRYDKYIAAAKRLVKAAYKTQEIDAANILNRATNSSYLGGDSVCLGSASHTLAYGGTWSNIASVYQTPSRAALITAISAIGKYPNQSGQIEGHRAKKIVCPFEQWAVWEGIVGSQLVPETNNNEINVVKKMGIEVVPVKYFNASTTAWGIVTDADNGLQWRNRRKMKSRTWVDNDSEVMRYGISYRSAKGWSDARGWYQGNT
jgi:hypothetical protein